MSDILKQLHERIPSSRRFDPVMAGILESAASEIESLRQQLADQQLISREANDKLIDANLARAELEQQLAEARAGRVPEGWKPAPHEPTSDMVEAATRAVRLGESASGEAVYLSEQEARLAYASMLFMAPRPPAGGVGLDERQRNLLRMIVPSVHERSRERGDAWDQASDVLAELLAAQPQQEVGSHE